MQGHGSLHYVKEKLANGLKSILKRIAVWREVRDVGRGSGSDIACNLEWLNLLFFRGCPRASSCFGLPFYRLYCSLR